MLVHNTITEGWFGSAYESDRFPKLNTKHGLHRFHDCVFADMMSHYSPLCTLHHCGVPLHSARHDDSPTCMSPPLWSTMCLGAVTDAGTIVQFAAVLFASINTINTVIALGMNSFFFSLLM